ncbi:MAG: PKD domain-containing protein [Euryarchaeota archaeon]|nr:PKD domain-containing protein [Euryarchaeota archaeon]
MKGRSGRGDAAFVAVILLCGGLLIPLVAETTAAIRNTNLTTVDVADLCPNFTAPAAQSVPVMTFTLWDDANNEDFTQARVTYNGTNLSDIKAARIYRESNNAGGTFNSATDILLGTNSTITANPVVLDFSYGLQRRRDRQFYIALDIADNATDGNRVDAMIGVDMLTIADRTWPDVAYNPAGNSTIDAVAPGNWTGFAPAGWSRSRTVDCLVNVSDWRSGLRVSSAEYQFSNDSGASWSNWRPATCTGADWTTANQTVTAASVTFGNDSAGTNLIRFRIRDTAGNNGTSPSYTVRIDTAPPGGWLLRYPLDWHSADRRPSVRVAVSDNLSGLDTGKVSAEYSVDGGGNWTPAPSVNCTGPNGSLSAENVTAWSVPFDRDSETLNLLRCNVSDAAGNWNVSPRYVIKIDSTPPDAPVLEELPRFANGSTRQLAWNFTPDALSGIDRFLAGCDDSSDLSSPLWTVETNGTTCEFTGLEDGVTYYYGVAARDLAGRQGNFSTPRECTQDASPPATAAAAFPAAPNGANGWYTVPVNLTLSASDNTSGVSRTELSLDGGEFTEGSSLLLEEDGAHTVAFRSVDLVGNVEPALSVTVSIDRHPPVARIDLPKTAYVNTTVQFDGSASTDAVVFLWNFGDGLNSTAVASGHVFTRAGMYRVTLTVTDRAGLTSTAAADINILSTGVNYPPEAVIGRLDTLFAGERATFSGAGSTDEDPAALSFFWTFGDGGAASGVTVVHTYEREGDYTLSLKVTDRGGLSGLDIRQVRVYVKGQDKAPLPHITQLNVAYVNEGVVFDGSNSTDEDLANCTFAWDLGDGATAAGNPVHHTYISAGPFTVRLTVTDRSGLSGTAQLTVGVGPRDNRPPVAHFARLPAHPTVGQEVEFNASGTVDESPATLNFTWNFGDGSVAYGRIVTHSYSSKGAYSVTLQVRDEGALLDIFSRDVTVADPEKPAPAVDWAPYMILALVAVMVLALAGVAASRRRRTEPAPPPEVDGEPHAPEGPQSLIAPTPVTHTRDEVVIEEGLNYLIDRETPETAYNTLSKMASEGASAMLVTPVHPNKVNKSYDMENVEMFWLSDVTGDTPSLDPAKMEYELAEKIITFIKEKGANAVVLLDGLELLIQGHGIEKVLEFIHTINEVASVSGATVLVNVNGKAMKEVEFNQLKRKFDRW